VNAVLPKNPFSTRFTRPEAVPFLCPLNSRLAESDASTSGSKKRILSHSVGYAEQTAYSTAGQCATDTSRLCDELVQRLSSAKFGVIVGPHGSGKTTLLFTLMPYLIAAFEGEGPAQVRQMQLTMPLINNVWSRSKHARQSSHAAVDCLLGLPRGSLLIIDGVEQLRRSDLKCLLRKSRRRGVFLLATSHTPVAGLSVLHQTTVDVMLIRSLADDLLENASPAVVEIVSRELQCRDLSGLTNVRDLWFDLYDIVQDQLLVDPMNLKDVRDGCSIVSSHGSLHPSDSGC